MKLALFVAALLIVCVAIPALVLSCGSIDPYPRRMCLYDQRQRFNTGSVIERRDDGAVLFRYDDHSLGDHGYRWITDADTHLKLKPCPAADAISVKQADEMFGDPHDIPHP